MPKISEVRAPEAAPVKEAPRPRAAEGHAKAAEAPRPKPANEGRGKHVDMEA